MNKDAARKALDQKISLLPDLQKMQRPHKGWIKAVKEALGMSSKQLAARLKVSAPRITALEKSELDETLTLTSLRRAAEALDCALVYSFVPKESFDTILQTRARRVAAKVIGKVDHAMLLEAQNLEAGALEDEIENLTAQILREQHKIIWDETK